MHTYTYTYNETTFHAEETTLKIKNTTNKNSALCTQGGTNERHCPA